MVLVLGIDDAGRGPIIGPMFLAGVLINQKDEEYLKHEGVADSKTLSHPNRVRLAGIIKDTAVGTCVVGTDPEQIDLAVERGGINLNTLEAMKAAEIINKLNPGTERVHVILDCPSVNILAWKTKLVHYVKNLTNLDISCEHKADANHPSVSAASILAKCAREEAVEEIQKKYGKIGSGYPSDPITKEFLRKYGNELADSGIFRKSWATWKVLYPGDKQKKLF